MSTQNYRKRAEEFINHQNRLFQNTGQLSFDTEILVLESEFKQVAQEARREENEACAKAVEKADCDPKCIPFGDHISSCQWSMLPEKIIRSRMEEK